jgi:hypothetical protein
MSVSRCKRCKVPGTDALRLAGAVHGAEDVSVSDPGRGGPRVSRHIHPRRHRDGPDAPVLTDEVHEAPPAFTLLDVAKCQRRHLRSAQPTPEQDGQYHQITKALQG